MTAYLITAQAALFSFARVVEAANKAEAAAQIDQTGLRVMWIEEAVDEE